MDSPKTPRIDLAHHAGGPMAAMARLEERIELGSPLRELVQLRASLINGCAFCIDMHWTEARAAGEPENRLAQLDAWAESPFYSDRERAVLGLTDAMTEVSSTHVPDGVWARAEAHFTPHELAHIVFAIAAINTWNRLQIASRALPASYSNGAANRTARHQETP